MWKTFYQGMDYTELPLFAMLLFIGVFVAVILRVTVARRASDFDPLAAMPLQPDANEGESR